MAATIFGILPHARELKFIVILRNAVARTRSGAFHSLLGLPVSGQAERVEQLLQEELALMQKIYKQAWDLSEVEVGDSCQIYKLPHRL